MTIALLLALLAWQWVPGRTYHRVRLDQLATTRHTHVCVTGPVVYIRYMKPPKGDGDYHVTLDDGTAKVVLEVIPALPPAVWMPDGTIREWQDHEGDRLPAMPFRKGQRIEACGISRVDRHHGWGEVHPVEWITVLR